MESMLRELRSLYHSLYVRLSHVFRVRTLFRHRQLGCCRASCSKHLLPHLCGGRS
jgi:hypothetical protein